MIAPAGVYARVQPLHLRPRKLYTAIVNNIYRGEVREVHRYVFQTSRYADFRSQIDSYRLEDDDGNARDAVFRLEKELSVAEVNLMWDIVAGNSASAASAAASATWADPFDRLVEGVLALPPLAAAVSTEFNVVRNEKTNGVVAIWLRCPEPFNDPKLPDDEIARSIRVLEGSTISQKYRVLHSKDRSQAIVMHPAKSITARKLRFRFSYIEWDGTRHVDRSTVTTRAIAVQS